MTGQDGQKIGDSYAPLSELSSQGSPHGRIAPSFMTEQDHTHVLHVANNPGRYFLVPRQV
jgi:hypothetical protein